MERFADALKVQWYRYVVDYTDVNGSLLGSGSMFNRTHMITIGYSIPLSREAWTETPSPR